MSSLSDFKRDDIEYRVKLAIEGLWEHDRHLLTTDASERSITHHLANYLQQQFQDRHVDVEYNRDGHEIKRLRDPLDVSNCAVYPDIIVHLRGTNDDNLLVIEVKKKSEDNGLDEQKLVEFTKPVTQSGLGYSYGLRLVLENDERGEESLQWFEKGKPCNE